MIVVFSAASLLYRANQEYGTMAKSNGNEPVHDTLIHVARYIYVVLVKYGLIDIRW